VQRVRAALFFSGGEAGRILGERLAGIDLSAVLSILLNACKDVAVYWGGSVLAGGALGGAIGAFAGGVGALPGAAIGAGLGSQAGAWVLGILGLKALLEDLGTALPEALHHYERGIRLAWGPVRHWESADTVFTDQDRASREIAKGHVVLVMAVLTALSAYLTRGRGDPAARARMLQEIRSSRRLGPKVADWVAANEEALARHPGLKPKEQQQVVMMAQAKPPAGPPMTPSQLAAAKLAGEGMPAQNKGRSGHGNATAAAQPMVLPPSRPTGTVIRNALSDTEFALANDIVSFRGGQFVGVPKESFPGIDGWLDGVPTQLKTVSGNGEQAILRNIVKGARNLSSQKYTGDLVVDATQTGVTIERFTRFVTPNTPVGKILNEVAVKNVYIKLSDGWLNITRSTLTVPGR
jgi:hypothetical protein